MDILDTAKDINNIEFKYPKDLKYNVLFITDDSKYYLYALYTTEERTDNKLFEISEKFYNELKNKKVIEIPVKSKDEIDSTIKDVDDKVIVESFTTDLLNKFLEVYDNLTVEETLELEKELNKK